MKKTVFYAAMQSKKDAPIEMIEGQFEDYDTARFTAMDIALKNKSIGKVYQVIAQRDSMEEAAKVMRTTAKQKKCAGLVYPENGKFTVLIEKPVN